MTCSRLWLLAGFLALASAGTAGRYLEVSYPKGDEGVEITWDAAADFDSGLRGFVVQRDGKELARLPEKPAGKFGRRLFQAMSYHDTPEKPLPEMRFLDRTARPGEKHEYRVIAVNGTGVRSEPSSAAPTR